MAVLLEAATPRVAKAPLRRAVQAGAVVVEAAALMVAEALAGVAQAGHRLRVVRHHRAAGLLVQAGV